MYATWQLSAGHTGELHAMGFTVVQTYCGQCHPRQLSWLPSTCIRKHWGGSDQAATAATQEALPQAVRGPLQVLHVTWPHIINSALRPIQKHVQPTRLQNDKIQCSPDLWEMSTPCR